MSKVILITGAPGSGKSTFAAALAASLGIYQVVGTDSIREVLRTAYSKEEKPVLHTSAIIAGEYAPEGEDKRIWGFIEQAKEVKPGVDAFIQRSRKENKDIIIEGIHLLPELYRDSPDTISVVLLKDEDQHKKQLQSQGEERSTYKIENFENAQVFQSLLKEQAVKYHGIILDKNNLQENINSCLPQLS